jgi:diguanylate cyclase (GGDEF)-like protein/PAS domain S-box-containing protein
MIDGIENENILQAICDNSYNAILITDSNLELPGPKIVYINKAFTLNTGYTLEDLKDKTPRILQGEETSRSVLDDLKARCKAGKDFAGSSVNYAKDGSRYYVEWNISPIKNKQGQITHYISIQRNITHELQTIATLQKIIDLQKNIIVITDGLKLNYVNESFQTFFGVKNLEEFLTQDDCVCKRFSKIDGFYFQKTEDENWIEALQALPSEQRIVSMPNHKKTPHGFFVKIDDFAQGQYIITFTDITESLTLKHKAYHDHLSGAYNREFIDNHFDAFYKQTQDNQLHVGLILFDIDNFKQVNDTYGHNVGDEIIKKIASITKKRIRSSDYLIRWGGEEFIVMTQVHKMEQVEKIAENIRSAIEKENFNPVPKVTSSFGVTISKKNESLKTLVKKADDALYEAKKSGKNRVLRSE